MTPDELLTPVVRERGGIVEGGLVQESYREASLGNIDPDEF